MSHPSDGAAVDIRSLVARAWSDPAFKRRLVDDPVGTLAAAGIHVPSGVMISVHESSATHRHLVLPPPPDGVLTDQELDRVAGGVGALPPMIAYLL